jgi:hypothetical protein
MMHCGWCFPIIIDVGVQFPVDASPISTVDVRSIYSPRMSQLAAIDFPNRRSEVPSDTRSKRSDGSHSDHSAGLINLTFHSLIRFHLVLPFSSSNLHCLICVAHLQHTAAQLLRLALRFVDA